MRSLLVLGLAVATVLPGPPCMARTWFVAPGAAEGGDGTSGSPFRSAHLATASAASGDTIRLREGTHTTTRTISVDGKARRVLLELPQGVVIEGDGRGRTILRAPSTPGAFVFGITASGVNRDSVLRDLTVSGPCFHGINLRAASPTIERVDLKTDLFGASSTAFDARDGSDPHCREVLFDGGHGALFVEFGSSGVYENCRIGRRPLDGAAISDATPRFLRCVFESAGRDGIVLNLGSQPIFERCIIRRADRWTVRVASGYSLGDEVDMGGNQWFTSDLGALDAVVLDASDESGLGARVVVTPLANVIAIERGSVGAWKARW